MAHLPIRIDTMLEASQNQIMDKFKDFLKDDSFMWCENQEMLASLKDWAQDTGPHFKSCRMQPTEIINTADTSKWDNEDWNSVEVIVNPLLAKLLILCQKRMLHIFLLDDMPTVRSASSKPEVGSNNFEDHVNLRWMQDVLTNVLKKRQLTE